MTITKTFTNLEIYNMANALLENFKEKIELPVKVNFYLQKNMNAVIDMAKELDQERVNILSKYGTYDEETQNYTFTEEQVEPVQKEINDLFSLEQDVKVYLINVDSFGDLELDSAQVAAISFMIEEDE